MVDIGGIDPEVAIAEHGNHKIRQEMMSSS